MTRSEVPYIGWRQWAVALVIAAVLHLGLVLAWQQTHETNQLEPGEKVVTVALGPTPQPRPTVPAPAAKKKSEPSQKPKPKPKLEPKSKPKPKSEPEPEPEPKSKPEPKPEPEPKPKPKPKPETTPEPKPQPEPRPQSARSPQPKSTSQSQARAGSGAKGPPQAVKKAREITPGARSAQTPAQGEYYDQLRKILARNQSYPRRAQRAGWTGVAVLYFVINRQGRVVESRIIQSAGHAILDKATREMLEKSTLPPVPAQIRGGRIAVTVPVAFRLR